MVPESSSWCYKDGVVTIPNNNLAQQRRPTGDSEVSFRKGRSSPLVAVHARMGSDIPPLVTGR